MKKVSERKIIAKSRCKTTLISATGKATIAPFRCGSFLVPNTSYLSRGRLLRLTLLLTVMDAF